MAKHLWPNFLHEPKEYFAVESHWENLWKTQIDPHGSHRDWTRWVNTNFADGTPFMDGNPVFSRISLRDRRSVRVIQNEPNAQSLALSFWLERGSRANSTVGELVISCELSNETSQYAAALMLAWVNRGEIILCSEFAKTESSNSGEEELEPASNYQLVA
jgi:hypothetical protein